jgi:hypothetical protein
MPALKLLTRPGKRRAGAAWRSGHSRYWAQDAGLSILHCSMVQQIDFTDKTDDIAAQQSKVRTSLMFDHAIV